MKVDQLNGVIRDNVIARRRELGLTQVQLASKISVDQAAISNIERGKSQISIEMLARLSDGLKTTPSALVSEGAFSLEEVA